MPDPEQLADDLRRAGLHDADVSIRRRAEYSSDASLYRVPPLVVGFPRSATEVAATLEVCRDRDVPLTTRGAGTSIAGNAVGPGVVLDLSRHLATPPLIDPSTRTATVAPGVVLDELQRRAAPYGLRFGPDPSTHDRCTIGGMIGNNACGTRAVAYGRTADNVVALDVLTGRGERVRVGAPITGGFDPATSPTLRGLQQLVRSADDVIRSECGRFGRQGSGYALEHLLPERGFDVARALVGSEGTCAVVLSATLRLVARPAHTLLVVLGYASLAEAADAAPGLLRHEPTAVEGLDARIVEVVAARRGAGSLPPLPEGRGWLFVELAGDGPDTVRSRVDALLADVAAIDAAVMTDPAAAARLWRIREDGAGLTSRTLAGRPAYAGWEDAAVPPAELGRYVRAFEDLLADYGLTSIPYGHFADGCLHVRIDFPLDRPEGRGVLRRFVRDAGRIVAGFGGSLSGEHGDGRARSELLPLLYTADAIRAFEAFKAAFDPDDVLNPGVVVRPRPLASDLRLPGAVVRGGGGFALAGDGGGFGAAVHRCVGIGRCRSDLTDAGGVMCPSFLATRDERESTRGRARVLQEMIDGRLVRDGWRSEEVADSLDLCLACKGCRSDCPAGVDMATYKAELLHQRYRHRLRPAAHYTLGWLPVWARLAGVAPGLANRALARGGRAAKRLGGIDPQRELPAFAPRTLRAAVRGRRGGPPGSGGAETPAGSVGTGSSAPAGSVALWADTFTDRFHPHVGVAGIRVLETAGFDVRLAPPGCCGLTWISTGQLGTARRHLRRLVDALAPVVRAGVPVVGLEPSCTAVLRSDALDLLGPSDPAARDVADGVFTFAEVLCGRPEWQVPRLDDVELVAQPHCHHHAVLGWDTDRALLEAAGARVRVVGGCCGLAGNFGVERGHHDVSVAVAETALLPAVRAAPPDAVVLADGFSCRTQLEQLGGRRARHLAELLAAR